MTTKSLVRAGYDKYFKKNIMRVNINVQDICNFKCSYCINNASKNKMKRQLDRQCLEEFIDDLSLRKNDEYLFAIAGGEPLIYPYIDFLVEKIDTSILSPKSIYFATNGSFLYEKGQLLYNIAKNTNLKFSISVHMEQINIDRFVKNILDFGHGDDIRCKILVAPGTLDESRKLLNIFDNYNIKSIISVVTYPAGIPYSYSDEEIDFLQKHETAKNMEFFQEHDDGSIEKIDRITRGLHPEKVNYQGMFCCAGVNALRLAPDGTVARCFGFLRLGEKFNLAKQRLKNIPELTKPCICPSHFCACLNFLQTPKWASQEYSPDYLN